MNQELNNEEKAKIIQNTLLLNLASNNYTQLSLLKEEEKQDSKLGASYCYVLTNKISTRIVEIEFFPMNNNKGFFITSIEENKSKGSFLLSNYIKAHEKKLNIREDFNRRTPDQDFQIFIKNYFQILFSLFNKNLKDILTGETWEKVPFDWGPYK